MVCYEEAEAFVEAHWDPAWASFPGAPAHTAPGANATKANDMNNTDASGPGKR